MRGVYEMSLQQCAKEGKYGGLKYIHKDYTLCAHWDLNAKGSSDPPYYGGCPGVAFINGYLKASDKNGNQVHPHWGGGRALVNGKWQCGVGGSEAVQVRKG